MGASVGALLIWQPAKKSSPPLTVFMPVSQAPEGGSATANNAPAALLAGLVRMLRKVPEICRTEQVNGVKGAHPTSATTIAAKKAGVTASPSKPSPMRNGTVPTTGKTQMKYVIYQFDPDFTINYPLTIEIYRVLILFFKLVHRNVIYT